VEALPGAVASAEAAPISSLEDAERFLEGLLDVEKLPRLPYARLDVEPARRLLARVGDPQRSLRVLHVAGSKGKGSTALLSESILGAAGERVGTFSSPHLERWTERFRLGGAEVPGADLAAAVELLRPHVEAQRREDAAHAPTFFDVTTAAAFLLFREFRVDRAVVEVGLGGRLDSTNVVEPEVACITTIELEHTDRLGKTHAAIAAEKAGIVKPRRPVVTGALRPEAAAVVEARARALDAPLVRLGAELDVRIVRADASGLRIELRDGALAIEAALPLLGAHQAANAALAVACVRRLSGFDDARTADAARRGLAVARLPGRVELLSRTPLLLVDGAHTAESARALASALALLPRARTRLVLSVSAGKDLPSILAALLPAADEVFVTRADATRSLAAADVAAAVRAAAPHTPVHAVPNPFLALRAAREGLGPCDLLCATGSIYLAGIARRVLAASAERPEA
jgi:dihydrofolate synthase/folylpolyglutamate synthase